MTKLGLHVHRPSPYVDEAIRSCRWAAVKALDSTQPLDVTRDAGIPIRILRLYGIENFDAGTAAMRWLDEDLSAVTHLQLVCEDGRGYDATWQQDVIDGVIAGGYRGRFLVGGFATGNPPTIALMMHGPHFPQLEAIYPLLRRNHVDLALDEYTGILASDPRWPAWAPYTSQRHRLILADLARHGIDCSVAITESGADNVTPRLSGGGWLTRGWSAAVYLATLRTLDRGDQADDHVLCRCIYTLGGTVDWRSYEIESVVPQLANYVRSQAVVVASSIDQPVQPAREGHAMPAPLFQFTQDAYSSDCWVECIRSFFLRYGYPLPLDTVFQAGKGKARPPGGEPATFAEVKHAVQVLAQQLGVSVQESDFDSPGVVAAALHDPNTANPWTIIAGVKEADLQPGQNYGHFIILSHEDSAGNVQVVDSYTNVDGNQSGSYPFAALAQAMIDNWSTTIDACGFKMTS